MEITIFTYIGVVAVSYWFCYPVLEWLDWGKKPWGDKR